MRRSTSSIALLGWLFGIALLVPQQALSKSTGKMNVEPGVYKIKTGTELPIKGPVIKVYTDGASTKYSHVASTHQTLPVLVKYTASCSNRGSISGGSVSIGDSSVDIDSGDGFSSDSLYINVPYSAVKKVDPAKHCNQHAKTLSLEKNKSLEKVVQKGFVMRVPNVLSAKGVNYCKAAGLGKGDVASDTTDNLGVYIQCVGNPKARAPRRSTSTRPASPKDPGVTKTNFKSATLKAATPAYVGDCPASMKFSGSITAKDKGEIQYQIIGDGNYSTPIKTMKFDKAGSKDFQWTRTVRKPDPSTQLATPGEKTNPNEIKGWMQLKVTYRIKNDMASAKKQWYSKKQNFKVTCGKVQMQIRKVQ